MGRLPLHGSIMSLDHHYDAGSAHRSGRDRRRFLASALAGTVTVAGGSMLGVASAQPSDARIRPFTFRASDAQLSDLYRRIAETKWPSRELVADASQGVQLATMRELAQSWQAGYDWRQFETRLNAL